jgi:hypothetical protein
LVSTGFGDVRRGLASIPRGERAGRSPGRVERRSVVDTPRLSLQSA